MTETTPLSVGYYPRPFKAPHFCNWVLSALPKWVKDKGGVVETTLDSRLQSGLEHSVAFHVQNMKNRNLNDAGAVMLNSRSGAVLAMVGSASFAKDSGQLNMTTHRRHPGSALKPFVYALALENGDTPASLAMDKYDVPSRYVSAKITQRERGPVRYREALAGSYNLAAIHVLEKVGEEAMISLLRKGGIGVVPGEAGDYGLRLALGATRVELLDLASGYGFTVNGGNAIAHRGIVRVVFDDGTEWKPETKQPVKLFSEDTSWLILDILSDDVARRPAFGRELPVNETPFRAAYKTGTARGFSDTVTVGVTEQITAAAWAGNVSGRATSGVVGMEGAAPIVRAALMLANETTHLTLPAPPDSITEANICSLSGMLATPDCPNATREYFSKKHVPTQPCTWH